MHSIQWDKKNDKFSPGINKINKRTHKYSSTIDAEIPGRLQDQERQHQQQTNRVSCPNSSSTCHFHKIFPSAISIFTAAQPSMWAFPVQFPGLYPARTTSVPFEPAACMISSLVVPPCDGQKVRKHSFFYKFLFASWNWNQIFF